MFNHITYAAKHTYDIDGLIKVNSLFLIRIHFIKFLYTIQAAYEGLWPFPKRAVMLVKQKFYLNMLSDSKRKRELAKQAFIYHQQNVANFGLF